MRKVLIFTLIFTLLLSSFAFSFENPNYTVGNGATYTQGQGATIQTGQQGSSGTQQASINQWAISTQNGFFTRERYDVLVDGVQLGNSFYYQTVEWSDGGTSSYKNDEDFINYLATTLGIDRTKVEMKVEVFIEIWAREPNGSYRWWEIYNNFNHLTTNLNGTRSWMAHRVEVAGSNLGATGRGYASYIASKLEEEGAGGFENPIPPKTPPTPKISDSVDINIQFTETELRTDYWIDGKNEAGHNFATLNNLPLGRNFTGNYITDEYLSMINSSNGQLRQVLRAGSGFNPRTTLTITGEVTNQISYESVENNIIEFINEFLKTLTVKGNLVSNDQFNNRGLRTNNNELSHVGKLETLKTEQKTNNNTLNKFTENEYAKYLIHRFGTDKEKAQLKAHEDYGSGTKKLIEQTSWSSSSSKSNHSASNTYDFFVSKDVENSNALEDRQVFDRFVCTDRLNIGDPIEWDEEGKVTKTSTVSKCLDGYDKYNDEYRYNYYLTIPTLEEQKINIFSQYGKLNGNSEPKDKEIVRFNVVANDGTQLKVSFNRDPKGIDKFNNPSISYTVAFEFNADINVTNATGEIDGKDINQWNETQKRVFLTSIDSLTGVYDVRFEGVVNYSMFGEAVTETKNSPITKLGIYGNIYDDISVEVTPGSNGDDFWVN